MLAHRQAGCRFDEGTGIRAREPFDASGNAGVDATQGDGVGNGGNRPQSRDAVGGDGLRLDAWRQPSLQDDFPREVRFSSLEELDRLYEQLLGSTGGKA